MLFNSLQFAVFLPVVFVLYWYVFKKLRWQNWFLGVASVFFYATWDWRFSLLLLATVISSYGTGLWLGRAARGRAWILWGNIAFNLGILAYFKYFDFFAESFEVLLRALGMHADFATLNIVLPVGISFYTFQALSYPIDVYKQRVPVTKSFAAFLAFVSFFPQLVAGPIERSTHLLPQMLLPRRFDYAKAVDGCRQMLWGFVKKIVVADQCALVVDKVLSNYTAESGVTLLLGMFFFSIQIYADFSAYSDIAIGCARLFGIELKANFNYPYFAHTLKEFWRRWHISLMRFFTDYVYIPLGGSRRGTLVTMRNVMIVFVLSGLWHGASWTFVVWGVYHGILLCFTIMYKKAGLSSDDEPGALRQVVMTLCTFLLVALGRVIYICPSVTASLDYMWLMVTRLTVPPAVVPYRVLLYSLALLGVDWVCRTRPHALAFAGEGILRYRACRWLLYYAMIAAIIVHSQQAPQAFIYFQF